MSNIKNLIAERNSSEQRLYLKYKNYALDVFRWNNLPEGIEGRYIEQALYEHGQCMFYKHPGLGLVVLPCYDSNKMDIYGDYSQVTVHSANGLVNDIIDVKDGVKIRNNELKIPTRGYIKEYSEKMFQVELAIKMNVEQQKFPYMIATNKKQELSMRNLIQKIQIGEPAIFHSDDLKMKNIEVFQTQAPYVADKLNQYRFELEREILTFIGVNNNFEKKERVIVDEVNSNNEFIKRNIEVQLKYRELACEEINKKFGLNISVEVVSDIVYDDMMKQQQEYQINQEVKPNDMG